MSYQAIQAAKKVLAALQADPTDKARLAELEAFIRAILGVEYKDTNVMDGSEASWTEPKYVREARQREADKATFREMLGYIGTTEQELRDLGVADDIFPD